MFLECHDVGHQLARVACFRQAVDHRYGGVGGKFSELPYAVGAQHDHVDVAGQHARRVGHRFAAAKLHVAVSEDRDMAAEVAHGHFEADAGARAGLFEQQGQGAAGQRHARAPAALHVQRQVEDMAQGGAVEIGQVEEMRGGHRNRRRHGRGKGAHFAATISV